MRVIDQTPVDYGKARRDYEAAIENWPRQLLKVQTVEPDTRTPEIETEIPELLAAIGNNEVAIAAEAQSLEVSQEQYQHCLLTDRATAERLAASMRVSGDVIELLKKENTAKQQRVAELQREKRAITEARQRLANEIRVAETINAAKAAAALHLEAIRTGFLAVREHAQNVLACRGLSSTGEIEKAVDMLQRNVEDILADLRLDSELWRPGFVRRQAL